MPNGVKGLAHVQEDGDVVILLSPRVVDELGQIHCLILCCLTPSESRLRSGDGMALFAFVCYPGENQLLKDLTEGRWAYNPLVP